MPSLKEYGQALKSVTLTVLTDPFGLVAQRRLREEQIAALQQLLEIPVDEAEELHKLLFDRSRAFMNGSPLDYLQNFMQLVFKGKSKDDALQLLDWGAQLGFSPSMTLYYERVITDHYAEKAK